MKEQEYQHINTSGLRTWVELNTEALRHNYIFFRSKVKRTTNIMAVVKSNAYGHGLFDISPELQKLGVDWFGVDSITEGLRLRKEGITVPILVLGYTLPELVGVAVENNISLTASTFDFLEECRALNLSQKIVLHIKVDTGLHRQGFLIQEAQKTLIDYIQKNQNFFSIEGLYTHFAQAKSVTEKMYTQQQITEFRDWAELFQTAGFSPLLHASATGGTLLYQEAEFDMVRIGAGLYGIWPPHHDEQHSVLENSVQIKPVLSWKTIITEVKKLPTGAGIGYNLSEILTRDSIVAICPIGYWHGLPRSASGVGEVLVRGMKAKILGYVSMDMIIIDVTDIPQASYRDEVVVIGESNTNTTSIKITAEDLAQQVGTTAYEIVTRLNPLMKKILR